jgi:transposase InsO family protein
MPSRTPFLIRLVAATILARQYKALIAEVAYLRVEIEFLREQIPKEQTVRFTDHWRKRLARAAAGVGWKRLAQIATLAKATTIRGWYRRMLKGRLGVKATAGPGAPRKDKEVEATVIRLAKENPTWGQRRIANTMRSMGVRVSPRTVAAILDRHGLKPAPERTTDWSWKQFITETADAVVASDFFTVDVPRMFGKAVYYVLFVIHLKSREVKILGITENPDEAFMAQVARNMTDAGDDNWFRKVGCRHLIHDGDGKFTAQWKEMLTNCGIDPVRIPAHSPNLNAFAERWVRTVKHELVRRFWFLDFDGLHRILHEYVRDHYNRERPHMGLGGISIPAAAAQIPAQESVTPFKASQVRCIKRCRGVIRHYYRIAA